MIARIWHGYTRPEHAEAYESMLKPELLPGISKVKGYRGSYLLRRNAGAEIEFVTIMLWDSIDAIRAVTGPDYETAVVPEERRKYLSRYDPKSLHYEIAATHAPWRLRARKPCVGARLALGHDRCVRDADDRWLSRSSRLLRRLAHRAARLGGGEIRAAIRARQAAQHFAWTQPAVPLGRKRRITFG